MTFEAILTIPQFWIGLGLWFGLWALGSGIASAGEHLAHGLGKTVPKDVNLRHTHNAADTPERAP